MTHHSEHLPRPNILIPFHFTSSTKSSPARNVTLISFLISRFRIVPLRLPLLLFLFLLSVLFSSCSPKTDPDWSKFLPEQTVLVYWGNDDQDGSLRSEIGELVGGEMLPNKLLGELSGIAPIATALIPESVDQLSTLWIYSSSADVSSRLKQSGWTSKGSYSISEGGIDLYENTGKTLASSTMGDWIVVSTKSRTIEQALRSANRSIPHLEISNSPGFHINAAEFGRLVAPLASSAFRASLNRSFQGLGVVLIRPAKDASDPEWTIELSTTGTTSHLIRYLMSGTSDPKATFNVPSGMSLGMVWNDPYGSRMFDSLRSSGQSSDAIRMAVASLAPHFSPEVAMYVSDGPSAGVAYVRKANMAGVTSAFSELFQRGLLDGDGEMFVGRDLALAKAICSGLCDLSLYTIGMRDDGVIISSSETLVRRLMVSDSASSSLESRVPGSGVSIDKVAGSYGWVDITTLITAARAIGWMTPERPIPGILRRFTSMAYSVQSSDGNLSLKLKLNTGSIATNRTDLILAWQYPLRGDQLVAKPVVAVLNGKSLVLATTKSGRVLAIGSDGNLQFEVTTGSQVPVGGVEVYDWYANRSPVVLQAAGSLIYGWSPSGTLLPGFPFTLDSPISAPIVITDVDANDEPEILAATNDERLHLINRNGRGVAGWPVFTNGMVMERPVTTVTDGTWSAEASTENAIETYDKLGQRLSSITHLNDWVEISDSLTNFETPSPFDGSTPMLYGQFQMIIDIDGDGIKELLVVLDGQLRSYRLSTNRVD